MRLGHSGAQGRGRAFCDRINSWAQEEGQPGLGYISGARGAAGPIAKKSVRSAPRRSEQLGLKEGDAVFFAAGNPEKFYKFAGEARTKIGERAEV